MGDGPSYRIVACPRCGAQHPEAEGLCHNCGFSLAMSGVGERATLPSLPREPTRSQPEEVEEPPVEAKPVEPQTIEGAHEAAKEAESVGSALSTSSGDMSMAKGQWKMEEDESGPPAPDPLIGIVVAGRYRIVECIGRGGMGVVYRVEHTEIGKLLALKLLAGELSRQKEVVRRFKREALLASRLTHPNSVQVFDFGVSEGLTYLVMELVVGRDLSRMLKAEPVQSTRLAKIMVQVCSSLSEAHGMGIVHRDIKPENIMVAKRKDGGDFAKVLDFGLAKLREAPELNQVTGTGQVVGTPYYMAPEQIHGHAVDGRADVYSVGAVMYEAMTGEPVFRGSSPMAVFTKHLTQAPEPLKSRAPNRMIPPAMDRIVLRCLEKSPEKRYQRIEDLQAALMEHLVELGQSGVDSLTDSGLSTLQVSSAVSDRTEGLARTLVHGEVATRDEVAAFKRKLARQRWLSVGVAALFACGAVYGGVRAYRGATAKPPFAGSEQEPNNQAGEATVVPFGRSVRGLLGKRIDAERSDRDFYRIAVDPESPVVSITKTALPNMATCLWVYREGDLDPLGRYCAGRPGKSLSVPAVRLEPGTFLFAVMQDRTSYDGKAPPFVQENVSDHYELTIFPATVDKTLEIEPNDAESVATPVPVGGWVAGRFDWVGDIDMVCAWPQDAGTTERGRWIISDAEDQTRDLGAVLEVTQIVEGSTASTLRLHRPGATGEPSELDVRSPWTSEAFEVSSANRQCVRLRLTSDPWAGSHAPLTPPVSAEQWKVRVEKVD